MILLDKPYVSEFLKSTIEKNSYPVINTPGARSLKLNGSMNIIDENDALQTFKNTDDIQLYTNSENTINWIINHLSFTGLPEKINLFKNKTKFRELIRPLYPDFYFREIRFDQLDSILIDEIPKPFIIKPSIGFFSMGVYKVTNNDEWPKTIQSITEEIKTVRHHYPREVMDASNFIIEQCIFGEEFAIDVYFNFRGEPVITNILQHVFSSDEDVSDRVYYTSKELIETWYTIFNEFLTVIGGLAKLKNFPMHVEVRVNENNQVVPVEINPMRFGGWCTTADLTWFAYGINPIEYYFSQKKPDWQKILEGRDNKIYSIIILDNSTGVDAENISGFEYEKLLKGLENPLELRKINYREYPVFGFVFTETEKNNFIEIEHILKSDLREFISISGKNKWNNPNKNNAEWR